MRSFPQIYLLLFLIQLNLFSQDTKRVDSLDLIVTSDTLQLSKPDSLIFSKSKSSLDTIVSYKALDSIKIDLKAKRMKLVNKADMKMGQRQLNAKYIEIDFEKSTLEAYPGTDSSGFFEGYPMMNDKGEEFAGERIKFNFKTDKGIISQGETQLDEGYYFGSKIKKVNKDDFFIKDGYYTPCEELEPSAYFASNEMKLESQNKIYMDPIVFYIQDLPFLVYPFGLFFSTQSGRKSGFIVPSYDFSDFRGVVLENFGFYWAASDYWDTQILADYYTKGGYLVKNQTRWKKGNNLNGNLSLQYGRTRFTFEEDYQTAYQFGLNNIWTITPYQTFTADMSFASENFNQRTQSNVNQRVQQNIRSTANYNINLEKWGNLSTGFSRDQNIIDNTYTQTPQIDHTLPNKTLFKLLGNDFNITTRSKLFFREDKEIETNIIEPDNEDEESLLDTGFVFNQSGYLSFSPSISYNLPKIWHFNFTPSINFGSNVFNRKLNRDYNPDTDEVTESFDYGTFVEYFYSYNLSFRTTVYGIANPKIGKLQSIRHTFQPTLNYSFRPDQSDPSLGFYNSYTDTSGREFVYRVFERDGGQGSASRTQQQSINYTLNNAFEVKLDQGDSVEAKKVKIMNVNFSGNYTFTDSIKYSDVRFNIQTPALKIVNISANGAFSLYDQDPIFNEDGEITRYERVNRFLMQSGDGFARLTSVGLNLNTSFSSDGIQLENVDPSIDNGSLDTMQSRMSLGSRFSQRRNNNNNTFDKFGDNTPGYNPVNVPWDVSIGLNYRLTRNSPLNETQTLNANVAINIEPVEGWMMSGSFLYDVLEQDLRAPNIAIRKNLGCWSMQFSWTPTGVHRNFNFSIGLDASQLQDFKYEKRSSNIY